MQEIKLTGIHDDGENLVLQTADGTSYLLPIDQNLRQSIAKARRISPLRGGSGGAFGPRDIQTRFRQGASVEEIAAESGWEPDRIRRYEWPIVAERANIISMAQGVVISTLPANGGSALSLAQHIEATSHRYSFAEADRAWSTWQQESGQWTVSLELDLSETVIEQLPRSVMFPARWSFNPANQSIYASNEAAYFLMGRDNSQDSPIPGSAPSAQGEPTAEPNAVDGREAEGASNSSHQEGSAETSHLTRVTVPYQREQHELLDELNARRGARSFDPASERKLADLLERARRNTKPVLAEQVTEQAEPEYSAAEKAPDETTTAQTAAEQFAPSSPVEISQAQEADLPPAAEPVESEDATDQHHQQAATPNSSEDSSETAVLPEEKTAEQADEAQPATPQKPSRAKRTSVPSWDDIIFGNQRR